MAWTRPSKAQFAGRPDLAKSRTVTDSPCLDKLWQAMRIMRARFTVADLMTVTETRRDVVQRYVRPLMYAGFVRMAKPNVRGQAGSYATYQLVRDSGPLSPIVWRARRHEGTNARGVHDRNTGLSYDMAGQLLMVEGDD